MYLWHCSSKLLLYFKITFSVYQRIDRKEAWIGLSKEQSNPEDSDVETRREGWSWEDGSPYNISGYLNWAADEPSNGTFELCVRMKHKKWRGNNCNRKYGCLCQRLSKYAYTFANVHNYSFQMQTYSVT